jgi:hypothetical protein
LLCFFIPLNQAEPLIFRNTTGEEYKIPGEVDLGFVIKFTAYQEQIKKLEKETDAIKKTQEIVYNS